MDEVLNYIRYNIVLHSNDYVVIGLSGGPDSMVLLNLLIIVLSKLWIQEFI